MTEALVIAALLATASAGYTLGYLHGRARARNLAVWWDQDSRELESAARDGTATDALARDNGFTPVGSDRYDA